MTYSDVIRAQALAELALGQSLGAVSRHFDIPKATIRGWRDRAGMGSARVDPKKRRDIGDLVARYLEAGLEAQIAQAEAFGDLDWLRKQSAADLAILHGVMNDKLMRVLAALQPEMDSPLETTPPR